MAKIHGGLSGFARGTLDDSLFDATEWNLYDWEMMLVDHPTLATQATAAYRMGIDARDAFFALCGRKVAGTGPVADSWRAVLNQPSWRSAISKAKTELDRFVFLRGLLDSMMTDDLDDEQPDDEQPNSQEDASLQDALQALMEQLGQAADESGEGELVVAEQGIPTKQDTDKAAALVDLVGVLDSFDDSIGKEETLEDALAIASKLDLRDFSSMLGFVSRVVRGASRKADQATGELTGYRNDTWSDKVVPHDMLAVAEGDLHAMIKLSEGELSTRDFKGERAMGKGPCILLRDETGSMEFGDRHGQALALEIALAQAMNDDGRDLVSIAWGDVRTRIHTWGDKGLLHTQAGRNASRLTDDDSGLQEHLTSFLNGSNTKLWSPLMEACRIADEYVDGADILVLSDGRVHDADFIREDSNLADALDGLRESGGRLWAVVIGGLEASKWSEKLPVMDGVISADDLREGDGLAKMLASMADRRPEGGPRKRSLT